MRLSLSSVTMAFFQSFVYPSRNRYRRGLPRRVCVRTFVTLTLNSSSTASFTSRFVASGLISNAVLVQLGGVVNSLLRDQRAQDHSDGVPVAPLSSPVFASFSNEPCDFTVLQECRSYKSGLDLPANCVQGLFGDQHPAGLQHAQGVQFRDRRDRHFFDVASTLINVHVIAGCRHQRGLCRTT